MTLGPELLAHNNAELCAAVCASHRLATRFDRDVWVSRTRTPQFYPDAVTLVERTSESAILERVDASHGCSIKDSFASLGLSPYGFDVLFDARWIVCRDPVAGMSWECVRDVQSFACWEAAWRGDDGPEGILLPSLLSNDAIAVLAKVEGDAVTAGALLNQSDDIVGISNFFTSGDDDVDWRGCVETACAMFPGATLVGYESGAQLEVALASGFVDAGPLRIWVK